MGNTENKSLQHTILAMVIAVLLLVLFFLPSVKSAKKEPATAAVEIESAAVWPELKAVSKRVLSNGLAARVANPKMDLLSFFFQAESEEEYQALLNWLQNNQLLDRGLAVLPQLKSLRVHLQEDELQRLLKDLPGIDYATDITLYLPEKPEDRPEWRGYAGLAFGNSYLDFLGVNRNNPERGAGLLVALLDTPVAKHSSLNSSNILTQDIFGLIAAGEGSNNDHGTAIASIIAGENSIAPAAKLLSIPIVGADGSCSAFDLATAIVKAVDSNANIISISLASPVGNAVLAAAVQYAADNDVIVVASAGNDGGERVSYPAAYPEVIAVGAIDAASEHAGFSNQGNEIALAAPGVGLNAAAAEDGWEYFSGTSAAVPCVVGVLANFLSANPSLDSATASQLLLATCDDTGQAGPDAATGLGVINANRLENWRTPGIYTAAAAGHYLVPDTDNSEYISVQISAQNTGTETLAELVLQTAVAGTISRETFNNVPPTRVVSVTVSVPVATLREVGSVDISSSVEIPGIEDARRDKRIKRTTLSLGEENSRD